VSQNKCLQIVAFVMPRLLMDPISIDPE